MIKNYIKKQKPYFSKKKYLLSDEDKTGNLLLILSDELPWFEDIDGAELKQLTSSVFITKNKDKADINRIIVSEWVEWEKIKR